MIVDINIVVKLDDRRLKVVDNSLCRVNLSEARFFYRVIEAVQGFVESYGQTVADFEILQAAVARNNTGMIDLDEMYGLEYDLVDERQEWLVTFSGLDADKIQTVVTARDEQTAIALAAVRQAEYIGGVDRHEVGQGLTLVQVKVIDPDGEPPNKIEKRLTGCGLMAALLDDGRVSMYDEETGAYIITFTPGPRVKAQFQANPRHRSESKMIALLECICELPAMEDYI